MKKIKKKKSVKSSTVQKGSVVSNSPVLNFGKHRGKKLNEVPIGYLGWLLSKYIGTSLTKEQIETEAKRRGCYKKNGNWGYDKTTIRGGFDPYDIGFGTMSGVVREWNDDNYDGGDPDNDYNYYGIPNTD